MHEGVMQAGARAQRLNDSGLGITHAVRIFAQVTPGVSGFKLAREIYIVNLPVSAIIASENCF